MGGTRRDGWMGTPPGGGTHLSACVRTLRPPSQSGESPGGWGSWKGRGRGGRSEPGPPDPITPRPPFPPAASCPGSEDPTQSCAPLHPHHHRPPAALGTPQKSSGVSPPPRARGGHSQADRLLDDLHPVVAVVAGGGVDLVHLRRRRADEEHPLLLVGDIPHDEVLQRDDGRFVLWDRGGGRDAVPLPALPPGGGRDAAVVGGAPGGGASPAWGRCISGPSLAGR